IRNSAHDSVCACSIDEVCDAVLVRYDEAAAIADGIAERAVHAVAASVARPGPVVVNPSARPRGGVVQVRLEGEGAGEGMQLVRQHGGESTLELPRRDAYALVRDLLDHRDGFVRAECELAGDGTLELTLERRWGAVERVRSARVENEMRALGSGDPDGPARIRIVRPPTRDVLVRVEDVPGFGWRRWPGTEGGPARPTPVTAAGSVLDNGLVRVELDPGTGSFSIDGQPGFGRLVDGGDTGDTYNYNPPADDRLVDAPVSATVTVVEAGPVRGRLAMEA